jgi:hypothetical protein
MKLLAMVEEAAKSARGERGAIIKMKEHYGRAADLGRKADSVDLFYALTNVIVAQLALGERVDTKLISETHASLERKEATGPDFWSLADHTNIVLYEAMATRQLRKRRARITAGYRDLAERVSAKSKWGSVYNTAAFVLTRYVNRRGLSKSEVDAARAILESLKKLMPVPNV